jgi:hypothetical protein
MEVQNYLENISKELWKKNLDFRFMRLANRLNLLLSNVKCDAAESINTYVVCT